MLRSQSDRGAEGHAGWMPDQQRQKSRVLRGAEQGKAANQQPLSAPRTDPTPRHTCTRSPNLGMRHTPQSPEQRAAAAPLQHRADGGMCATLGAGASDWQLPSQAAQAAFSGCSGRPLTACECGGPLQKHRAPGAWLRHLLPHQLAAAVGRGEVVSGLRAAILQDEGGWVV